MHWIDRKKDTTLRSPDDSFLWLSCEELPINFVTADQPRKFPPRFFFFFSWIWFKKGHWGKFLLLGTHYFKTSYRALKHLAKLGKNGLWVKRRVQKRILVLHAGLQLRIIPKYPYFPCIPLHPALSREWLSKTRLFLNTSTFFPMHI